MKRWSWELPDWPDFYYNPEPFEQYETEFLQICGQGIGMSVSVDDDERKSLRVEMLSEEALKTSRIEGEILDRASVQSSIRKNLGLQEDRLKPSLPREKGVADLMTENYKTYASPLSKASLCAGHRLLMVGQLTDDALGRYRPGSDPMQIVSGDFFDPKIHYEAPPSVQVAAEMQRFVAWFNETQPTSEAVPLPALTRAGMAHLHFESIHPFSDGNGRIGRAVAEKALSQAAGFPILASISHVIEARRKKYYEALASTRFTNEITEWLTFFADAVVEAMKLGILQTEFLVAKNKFFAKHGSNLNKRQEKALLRIFREGPTGFQGGLSAGNYISITKTSPATARRDLGELVELGIFSKTGERKGTRYFLELPDLHAGMF